MTALAVVEDLDVLEDGVGELDPRAPPLAVEEFDLHPAQNESMTALSKQSPTEPIDGSSPESIARRVKVQEVNCVP